MMYHARQVGGRGQPLILRHAEIASATRIAYKAGIFLALG
jgi:hypothetical protein